MNETREKLLKLSDYVHEELVKLQDMRQKEIQQPILNSRLSEMIRCNLAQLDAINRQIYTAVDH